MKKLISVLLTLIVCQDLALAMDFLEKKKRAICEAEKSTEPALKRRRMSDPLEHPKQLKRIMELDEDDLSGVDLYLPRRQRKHVNYYENDQNPADSVEKEKDEPKIGYRLIKMKYEAIDFSVDRHGNTLYAHGVEAFERNRLNVAENYFRRSMVENGDGRAAYALGIIYGINNHFSAARELYVEAAEAGVDEAIDVGIRIFEEGYCGFENMQLQKCLWFEEKALTGNAFAAYYAGECYSQGLGVEEDRTKAIAYFQTASKWNDPFAINALGDVLFRENRCEEAAAKFMEAAMYGNINGIYNIADCYENGVGVKKNYLLALRNYQRAFDMGNLDAVEDIARVKNAINADADKRRDDIIVDSFFD